MNKKKMMIIIGFVLVGAIAVFGGLYATGIIGSKGVGEDGAEVEVSEDATGFSCACGCSDGNEMKDCQCQMCAEHEEAENAEDDGSCDESMSEENSFGSGYFYEDPETGELTEVPANTDKLIPMDEDQVEKLVAQIEASETLCIRRCKSMVIDDGGEEPVFKAEAESRYYYDATSSKVYNADGKDISSTLNFSIKGCEDSYDFLEKYFKSRGISTDFVTDDLSHTKDLLMNQRVYSFGVDECQEIKELEEEMDGIDITELDCTYQVKTYEDGIDRMIYVTITVAGQDADGVTVVRYITYIIDYNPGIPGQEVAA